MGAIITALRDFIARDLMFLFGGSMVLASLIYSFSSLDTLTSNGIVLALIAGVAYVLGWVIQDVFCILGLVRVSPYESPKRFYRYLYKRLLGKKWVSINLGTESLANRKVRVYESASERNLIEIERFISLKQVASTISPSSLLASVILMYRYFGTCRECTQDLLAAIVLLIIGIFLIPLNRIKAAQQAQYIWRLSDHLPRS